MTERVLSDEESRSFWPHVKIGKRSDGSAITAHDAYLSIRYRDKQIAELQERLDMMGEVGLQNDHLKILLKEWHQKAEDLDGALSIEEADNVKLRYQYELVINAMMQIYHSPDSTDEHGWDDAYIRKFIGSTLAKLDGDTRES